MITDTEERLLKYIEDRARENIKEKNFYKMTDVLYKLRNVKDAMYLSRV